MPTLFCWSILKKNKREISSEGVSAQGASQWIFLAGRGMLDAQGAVVDALAVLPLALVLEIGAVRVARIAEVGGAKAEPARDRAAEAALELPGGEWGGREREEEKTSQPAIKERESERVCVHRRKGKRKRVQRQGEKEKESAERGKARECKWEDTDK